MPTILSEATPTSVFHLFEAEICHPGFFSSSSPSNKQILLALPSKYSMSPPHCYHPVLLSRGGPPTGLRFHLSLPSVLRLATRGTRSKQLSQMTPYITKSKSHSGHRLCFSNFFSDFTSCYSAPLFQHTGVLARSADTPCTCHLFCPGPPGSLTSSGPITPVTAKCHSHVTLTSNIVL